MKEEMERQELPKCMGRKMKKRCLSLLVAAAMLVSTPAAEGGFLQGIFPNEVKNAQAVAGQIDQTLTLNQAIQDVKLRAYLQEKTSATATVTDLRSLTDIEVPSGVTDLTGLGYATGVVNLDLSNCSANKIEASEFANCEKLKTVTMAASIKELGDNAFNNCNSLQDINLSNLDTIGSQAFSGCAVLTDTSFATLKDSVKSLGSGAFSGCKALTEAKVPTIQTGDDAKKVPAQLFNGCSKLEKVTFCDDKIVTVSNQAFAETGDLSFSYGSETDVKKFPSSVTAIGMSAFSGSRIASLDLSNLTGLQEIASSTFFDCLITEIKLPQNGGLQKIGASAFEKCRLKEIVIPNTVTEMGDDAFKNAGNLLKVSLSTAITEIPKEAFQMAGSYDFTTGAESTAIEWKGMEIEFTGGDPGASQLATIGGSAFNASSVSNDFLKDLKKLETIKEAAFSYTDFKKVTIPACVKTIEKNAFNGMYWLTELEFAAGSKVTELPENFVGDSKIHTDNKTFADLVLKKVTLPDKLEKIGKDSFGYCCSLHTVGYSKKMVEGEMNFPDTLKEIGELAFENCGLYDANKLDEKKVPYLAKCVNIYPGEETIFNKIIIPDSVTVLGKAAFQKTMVKRMEIGKGVTVIPENFCREAGYAPFKEESTSRMTEQDALITPSPLPSGVIGSLPDPTYNPIEFVGLTSVKLPDQLEKIEASAFESCVALVGFGNNEKNPGDNLPNTLTSIGNNAFKSCKSIGSVTFPSSLEEIGTSAFEGASQTISQSIVSQTTGRNVSYPRQYGKTYSFDMRYATNLKTIGDKAFSKTNITSIVFPDSVTKIPSSVCEGCYNLETATIPETVTEIGGNAFKDTFNLGSMTAPLTATWADTIFEGVAARKSGKLTINSATNEKTDNVYLGQESVLSFNCISKFDEVRMTVTDKEVREDSPKSDLSKAGNEDANQYVTVNMIRDSMGHEKSVSLAGKAVGKAKLKVAASIDLKGNPKAENNTTKRSDTLLTLQVSQDYVINVTNNEINVLSFTCSQLVEEALGARTIYLGYGSTSPAKVDISWLGSDPKKSTTDTVDWRITDESVAKLSNTPAPTESASPDGDVYGVLKTEILPVELGDTELTAKSSSGKEEKCKISVRVPFSSFSFKESSVTRDIGKTFVVEINKSYSSENQKLIEENKTYEDVYDFYSSDKDIATVMRDSDGNAEIKTVAEGEATITAKAFASNRTVTCKVTVQKDYVPSASSLKIQPEGDLEIYVGDQPTKLSTVLYPADASDKVTWSSSATEIATVDAEEGTVTPVKAGNATITATTESGKTASCKVKVLQHVESLKLDMEELTLFVDKTQTLKAEILPADAEKPTIKWTSSDESVATVENGTVKGVKVGTASIKAEADGKTAICAVNVKIEPESIKLSENELSLFIGDAPAELTAGILPLEASQTVSWSSSNEEVATVSADGKVSAGEKTGSATITAKTENNKSDTCKVTVKKHVETVTLKKTELTLIIGKSETLSAEVAPTDASDKTVAWTTSDESIAKVDEKSGKVEGVKTGKATITATADGKSAACAVTVVAEPKSVILSAAEASLEAGKQLALTASVDPADASQAIEWKSSDETVATVENGVVTALKEGSADITATAAGTSIKASCKLTVTPAAPARVKLKSAKNVKKKSILVKWGKVKGAEGYQVACGSKKKTTTKTSLKFKKLKKKKKYAVKVRAYITSNGKQVFGKWSKTKKVKVKR